MAQFKRKKPGLRIKFLLVSFLLILVWAYVLVSLGGAYRMTTSPDRKLNGQTPASFEMAYQEVDFQSTAPDRATMRGWWIPKPGSNRALILLHGQNSNRTEHLELARELWEYGYNLLLYDLRGHGQSDGLNHTYGFQEQKDVTGAVQFLKQKGVKPASLGIYGGSLGGAITILGMKQNPEIQAGVADSAFALWSQRTRERLGVLYPGVALSSRLLLNYEIEQVQPVEAIKRLNQRPVLLIHGDQDAVIPVSDAYALRQAGGPGVQMWITGGLGHLEAYRRQPAEFLERVLAFYDKNLAP